MTQEQSPVYYMRDNHTFKQLSADAKTALAEIESEFNAGYTHGMLCSHRPGFKKIHAQGDETRAKFFAECKKSLEAALAKRTALDGIAEELVAIAAELDQRPAAQAYAPDKFCFTEADGSCSSKDPRCMHQLAHQHATPATPEDMKVYDGIAAGYFADTQQATPEPVGWTDADVDAARLAMELECLLLDTKDTAAVSRWWKSANEALDLHRARLAAAQAKGDAA